MTQSITMPNELFILNQSNDYKPLIDWDKETLSHFLNTLPSLPGVYRHIDAHNVVLYIGKAKHLRNRIQSYFLKTLLNSRIEQLVRQIVRIEITITRSESEALLLENNLIKTLQPKYNIVFKDDKSYPMLGFSGHTFPRMTYFRGNEAQQSSKNTVNPSYFGPYPNAYAVKKNIQLLQELFKLRDCEDSVFNHRTRPCLQYQIKRCSAPCVGFISQPSYQNDVASALQFLNGNTDTLLNTLRQSMQQHAQALEFEDAAVYRNQIERLSRLQQTQIIDHQDNISVDIVAVVKVQEKTLINLAMVRGGRHLGDRIYTPKHTDDTMLIDVLSAFIHQYYFNPTQTHLNTNPSVIVVDYKYLNNNDNNIIDNNDTILTHLKHLQTTLSNNENNPITLIYKPQGVRRLWLEQAHKNALFHAEKAVLQTEQLLYRLNDLVNVLNHYNNTTNNTNNNHIFNLNPTSLLNIRIECFDVSHTDGEATQASCVVFEKGNLQPKLYQRFNINNITGGDDYGAIKQVILRRYKAYNTYTNDTNDINTINSISILLPLPDLILIDGGIGQVNCAVEAFKTLGLGHDIHRMIGISKGDNRTIGLETLIFTRNIPALKLPNNSPALLLLALIRDEAHRFAITGMRLKRAKPRKTSRLEDIKGIGAKRRQSLLKRWGGLDGVINASIDDLMTVEGISHTLATVIYEHFHS